MDESFLFLFLVSMKSFFLLSIESIPVLFFITSVPIMGVEALREGTDLVFTGWPSGSVVL